MPTATLTRTSSKWPATALRATVGHTIPLTPPFGVVFAAWDAAAGERWIQLAGTSHEQADEGRWRRAVDFARRHGYSYSILAPPGIQFGHVMEELARTPDSEPNRHTRDELMEQLRRSEYLATRIEHRTEVQLVQISAPVFDLHGTVVASIMMLGSMRPITGEEVEALGGRVVLAAERATTLSRGLRLGEPAPAV